MDQNSDTTHNEQAEIAEPPHKNNADSPSKREGRFKDGDPLTMIKVRFPGNAKSFSFLLGKRTFMYGQKVMAMSDRGMTVGYINSFPYEVPYRKDMGQVKSIARLASQDDIEEQKSNIKREKEAEIACNNLIEKT